ncbi:MAG: DUF2723 domain-containing protein [Nitrospiraceae bacterium]|nr:DUF2723 domain-containing protein [Nitrospiraceae bacterium]
MITIFLIYLFGLCPSIYVGDSSLFAAASFSIGTTHPPGYPLFVLLGKLMTFLPVGNVAMRVNLVSAISGTLACLLVYRLSMELTEDPYASWSSALICGISPLFFPESLKAEAYTLNSFLGIAVFYLGLRMLDGGSILKNGLTGLFVIGLGMGNQHTIGFMCPILLFPIAVRWKELRLKWLPFAVLTLLAGFSVNSLIYLRSLAMVRSGGLIVYSFGGSWEDFLRVLLRLDYKVSSTPGTIAHAFTFGKPWYYAFKNSLQYIVFTSTRPVFLFLLAGIVGLRKKRAVLLYFLFAFIIWFGVLAKMVWAVKDLTREDFEVMSVYFLPSVPILYCLVAVGFSSVLALIKKLPYKILPKAASYALLALPFALLPYSYKTTDADKAPIAYDFGKDMLLALPVNSLLFNYHDNAMFVTFYMRAVERYREDVLVIDTSGRKDIYGMESSPGWKYAGLYPFFYKGARSSVKEINAEFANRGKLFSNNPFGMTETVSKKYCYYPYIFSVGLYPCNTGRADIERFKRTLRAAFKANYVKMAYEDAETVFPADDFLVQELLTGYAMNTMVYADFVKRDGEKALGDELYQRAFSIQYPERYLWPYLNFLVGDGRQEEALEIARRLKSNRDYGKFAEMLEERTISAVSAERR